ncbi:MAG: efflux RND transporter periplasmic adaptor subunit [Nitrospinaceae bacterium]
MTDIDDLLKEKITENSSSREEEQAEVLYPSEPELESSNFEEEVHQSRFRLFLTRTGNSMARLWKGIKSRFKNEIPEEDYLSDSSDADILFPKEEDEKEAASKKKKRGHGFLKIIGWPVLLIIVFLLGFFTRPDMMDNTLKNVEKWSALVFKEMGPIQEKVSEKVTEIIDKNVPVKGQAPAGSGDGEKPQRKIKYWKAPMTPGFISDKPGKSPMGMDLVPVYEEEEAVKPKRKIKYWKAPMTPGFISDKPGKSPMGMDLIPVYEDEANTGPGIRINPNMVQNIGIKTAKVKRTILTREVRTVGHLTYDERLVTHIHTKYEGWAEKLYVDFRGQEVKKDDLLLEIYSPELVSTQEELLLALKYNQSLKNSSFKEISGGAKRLLESTRRRLELFDVPEHQIEALIRDKKITKTMHIHSPFRGFVTEKHVLQGMYVKPGMNLYTIADLSNIWVLADVYEYELPWVKLGQPAQMTLSYFPGKKFKGKVTYVDPFLDPKTRTVKVRMEFDNPEWKLKPDMYANVNLESIIAKRAVAVPEDAIIRAGEKDLVIIRNSSGGFEPRRIILGAQAKGYYQVLKGLRGGEEVVTSSNFLIDSESNLGVALSKMQSTKPPLGKNPPKKTPSLKKKMTMKKEEGGKMDLSKMKGKQNQPTGMVKIKPEP